MELAVRTELPGLTEKRTRHAVPLRIAYVEGLYVVPEFRGGNVARRRLEVAREWAREKWCTVCASDRAGRVIVDRRYKK